MLPPELSSLLDFIDRQQQGKMGRAREALNANRQQQQNQQTTPQRKAA